ncbi:MAG: hypothetical protein V3U24_02420 [Candidatus Neomarinimicrobiota bacterium]
MGEYKAESLAASHKHAFCRFIRYSYIYDARANRLTMAIDAFHPINNTESVYAGFEWSAEEGFTLEEGQSIDHLDSLT